MTYHVVENNGVYGLTKGQFSATSDRGSKSKKGVVNSDAAIDLVGMALQLGATFVARSFSGDKTQLVPLIQAALTHRGAAFIDVISPCVQFNNHAGSTKSFDYVREHNEAVNRLDVILRPVGDHHRPAGARHGRTRHASALMASVLKLKQAAQRLRPDGPGSPPRCVSRPITRGARFSPA